MIPQQRFKVLVLVLVVTSAVPVTVADQSYAMLVSLVAAAVLSWLLVERTDRSMVARPVVTVAAVTAAVAVVIEWYVYKVPEVLALAHFFIIICICKFFERKTNRDYGQVLVVSLLLMVIGAIVNATIVYPITLAVFLTLGIYALMLLHFKCEADELLRRRRDAGLKPDASSVGAGPMPGVVRLSVSTGLGVLLIGLAIFLLFPRVGGGLLAAWEASGQLAVTGFTSHLGFGQIGRIMRSRQVVMHVQLERAGQPIGKQAYVPYFRGLTFDRYEQVAPTTQPRRGAARPHYQWKRTSARHSVATLPLRPDGPTSLVSAYGQRSGDDLLYQHYWLEQFDEPYLFAIYPAVLFMSPDLKEVKRWARDQTLSVEVRGRAGTRRYTVGSPMAVSGRLAAMLDQQRRADDTSGRIQPDQIPVSHRVRRLSERLAAEVRDPNSSADDDAIATHICDYLSSAQFAHTLDQSDADPDREPIEDFLFHRRRGHCEYFASAMAVMCQLAGVRARVVTGYKGGEYNQVGGFYCVRGSDAHSWVEVYVPDRDWVVFDPTPPRSADERRTGRRFAGLRAYLDFLQFQWTHLVVAYDAANRKTLLGKVRSWFTEPGPAEAGIVARLWRFLLGPRGMGFRQRLLYWVVLALAAALCLLAARLAYVLATRLWAALPRRERPKPRRWAPEAAFYEQLLERLARLGYAKPGHQTPREFARELAAQSADLAPVGELVEAFYKVQFGRQALSQADRETVEGLLDKLARVRDDQPRASVPSDGAD